METKVLLCPSLASDGWMSIDLFRQDLQRGFAALGCGENFQVVCPDSPVSASALSKQWARYVAYPKLIRKARQHGEVVHVLDHSYGHLCKVFPDQTVATCHDIAEFHLSSLGKLHKTLWEYRVRSLKYARYVATISEFTRQDVIKTLGLNEDRVVTVHGGVDAAFQVSPNRLQMMENFRVHHKLEPDTWLFLHVGSNILRKNIPTMLAALGALRHEGLDFRLFKVGDPILSDKTLAPIVEKEGLTNHIVEMGKVSNEKLVAIYNVMDALLFPSTYEGFGRPAAEAMACGTPTILARATSLIEVGGDAALFHEPLDSGDLAKAIRLLVNDPVLRRKMIADGIQQAAKFTWEEHCRKLLRLYVSL